MLGQHAGPAPIRMVAVAVGQVVAFVAHEQFAKRGPVGDAEVHELAAGDFPFVVARPGLGIRFAVKGLGEFCRPLASDAREPTGAHMGGGSQASHAGGQKLVGILAGCGLAIEHPVAGGLCCAADAPLGAFAGMETGHLGLLIVGWDNRVEGHWHKSGTATPRRRCKRPVRDRQGSSGKKKASQINDLRG